MCFMGTSRRPEISKNDPGDAGVLVDLPEQSINLWWEGPGMAPQRPRGVERESWGQNVGLHKKHIFGWCIVLLT